MSTLREAAQQALEAMESISDCYVGDDDDAGECASCHERSYKPHAPDCKKQNAITALRAELAQQAQEPVTQMRGNALARWAHEQEEPPDTGWQRDWQRGYETARRWVRQVGLPSLAQQEAPKGGGNLPPPLQAEPVQEPVAPYAWMAVGGTIWRRKTSEDDVPLYTRPPRREWQSLSEEDMEDLLPLYSDPSADAEMLEFARAIEAKLKEKNHD